MRAMTKTARLEALSAAWRLGGMTYAWTLAHNKRTPMSAAVWREWLTNLFYEIRDSLPLSSYDPREREHVLRSFYNYVHDIGLAVQLWDVGLQINEWRLEPRQFPFQPAP